MPFFFCALIASVVTKVSMVRLGMMNAKQKNTNNEPPIKMNMHTKAISDIFLPAQSPRMSGSGRVLQPPAHVHLQPPPGWDLPGRRPAGNRDMGLAALPDANGCNPEGDEEAPGVPAVIRRHPHSPAGWPGRAGLRVSFFQT